MSSQKNDPRFAKVSSDPRFRTFRKKDKKTKIDQRFKGMLTDDQFKLQYSMDKRGRSKKHVITEDYKNFYSLDDNEEEDDNKVSESKDEQDEIQDEQEEEEQSQNEEDSELKLDQIDISKGPAHKLGYHRGEIDEDSSSSSSDSEEEDEDDDDDDLEHEWGELDKDAPKSDDVSCRLAICNADWDKITAQDVYVLLSSFKPATGSIHHVRIYYSQFGLERLKVEETRGPSQFIFGESNPTPVDDEHDDQNEDGQNDDQENDDDEEATDTKTTEKFRKYQLERLKYFYAVAEFDSTETAEAIYTELDGLEYESSATTLDIRFVPNEMNFEGEKLKEECLAMPSASDYRPPTFVNTALQQSKVKLTWDETDHKRRAAFEKAFDKDVQEDDLKAYVASSSDDDELDDERFEIKADLKDTDKIAKYKELLQKLNKKDEEFEMEVTWDPNLKSTTEDLIQHKDVGQNKSNEIQDNLVSDEDDSLADSESEEELPQQKRKNKRRKHDDEEESKPVDSSLDLLMLDVHQEGKSRKHFNYKNIVERQSKKNKKNAKASNKDDNDGFEFNAEDPRFGAIYTSHLYNVDQSNPNFKNTEVFKKILNRHKKKPNLDR